MRHIRSLLLLLTALLLPVAAARADVIYGPGLCRAEAAMGYEQASVLAERMGVGLTDGMPLYKPANAQPLNAYMAVDPECEVGIDRDDIHRVAEKGLIPEITGWLKQWMDDIQQASDGAIRFVGDPNDADVLVSARQSFRLYGEYAGGGMSAEGYSCVVQLKAVQLTNRDKRVALTQTNDPGETVTLRGNGRFWKTPPKLAGTEKLMAFVNTIMGWYGYGVQKGSKGAPVKRVQQSLIRRCFLGGSADGSFGPRTESAVMALQEAYGLKKTGIVNRRTLVAVYYDHAAVDAMQ